MADLKYIPDCIFKVERCNVIKYILFSAVVMVSSEITDMKYHLKLFAAVRGLWHRLWPNYT